LVLGAPARVALARPGRVLGEPDRALLVALARTTASRSRGETSSVVSPASSDSRAPVSLNTEMMA